MKHRIMLSDAIESGNLDDIRDAIVVYGDNPNIIDSDDRSPLYYAALDDNIDAIKVLIECGADVDFKDKYGWTALFWLTEHPFMLESLVTFLKHNPNPNTHNDHLKRTPLHWASKHTNCPAMARLLFEHGADCGAKDTEGLLPIHVAAANNTTHLIDLFCKNNISPNATDNQGLTPLHYVAQSYKPSRKTIDCLINHGANINALDNEGRTVLHISRLTNHHCAEDLFDSCGACKSIRDNYGNTYETYSYTECLPQYMGAKKYMFTPSEYEDIQKYPYFSKFLTTP